MYLNKSLYLFPSTLSAQSLTSATDVQTYSVTTHCNLARAECKIQTAVVSSGNVVVQFVKRPTTGSATGEVVLATINILPAALVGTTVYADVSTKTAETNSLFSGQELIVRVLTAAAGGGAAGTMFGLAVVTEDPEVPLNEPNLVLST